MTTLAKLLKRKQQLLQRLEEEPGSHEREEIERLLLEIDEALDLLEEARPGTSERLSNSEPLRKVRRHFVNCGRDEGLEHDCRYPSARLHARDARLAEDRPNRAHGSFSLCPLCIDDVASRFLSSHTYKRTRR